MLNVNDILETIKMIDEELSGCAYHHHGYFAAGLR